MGTERAARDVQRIHDALAHIGGCRGHVGPNVMTNVHPDCVVLAPIIFADGYLPPDQADALRVERDQANAHAETVLHEVRDHLRALNPSVPPAGASALIAAMTAVNRALAPGAADAHDQRVRAEALREAAEVAYSALDPVASEVGDRLRARADLLAADTGEA